jgi:putative oxidoreductase
MVNVALLVLRVTFGSLLAGHGAQKLFGWFGGGGLRRTTGWVETLGLRPGRPWAWMAGLTEFGGGVLTLLGVLNPVGPLAAISSMAMATAKVHWGKPIWATRGGAELPVTNMAVATALICAGPGAYSLDEALGIRMPRWVAIPGLAAAVVIVLIGVGGADQRARRWIPRLGNLSSLGGRRQNGRSAQTPEQAVAELSRGRG